MADAVKRLDFVVSMTGQEQVTGATENMTKSVNVNRVAMGSYRMAIRNSTQDIMMAVPELGKFSMALNPLLMGLSGATVRSGSFSDVLKSVAGSLSGPMGIGLAISGVAIGLNALLSSEKSTEDVSKTFGFETLRLAEALKEQSDVMDKLTQGYEKLSKIKLADEMAYVKDQLAGVTKEIENSQFGIIAFLRELSPYFDVLFKSGIGKALGLAGDLTKEDLGALKSLRDQLDAMGNVKPVGILGDLNAEKKRLEDFQNAMSKNAPKSMFKDIADQIEVVDNKIKTLTMSTADYNKIAEDAAKKQTEDLKKLQEELKKAHQEMLAIYKQFGATEFRQSGARTVDKNITRTGILRDLPAGEAISDNDLKDSKKEFIGVLHNVSQVMDTELKTALKGFIGDVSLAQKALGALVEGLFDMLMKKAETSLFDSLFGTVLKAGVGVATGGVGGLALAALSAQKQPIQIINMIGDQVIEKKMVTYLPTAQKNSLRITSF
jgi:hypothetical protein